MKIESIKIKTLEAIKRKLVLFNFFRAEAEWRVAEGDNAGIIYAIEEPKTWNFSNDLMIIRYYRGVKMRNHFINGQQAYSVIIR